MPRSQRLDPSRPGLRCARNCQFGRRASLEGAILVRLLQVPGVTRKPSAFARCLRSGESFAAEGFPGNLWGSLVCSIPKLNRDIRPSNEKVFTVRRNGNDGGMPRAHVYSITMYILAGLLARSSAWLERTPNNTTVRARPSRGNRNPAPQ